MSELLFAVKTLLASALLVTLMQVKVSGYSIEERAEYFLKSSTVAHFIQGAAVGAILASKDLYKSVTSISFGSDNNRARASK